MHPPLRAAQQVIDAWAAEVLHSQSVAQEMQRLAPAEITGQTAAQWGAEGRTDVNFEVRVVVVHDAVDMLTSRQDPHSSEQDAYGQRLGPCTRRVHQDNRGHWGRCQ